MNSQVARNLLVLCLVSFLSARITALAAETNAPMATNFYSVKQGEAAGDCAQLQAEVRAELSLIQQSQQAAIEISQSNVLALAHSWQSVTQTVASQQLGEANATRQTQQMTLWVACAFGLGGLGVLLLSVYLLSRAFSQLAQATVRPQLAAANGHSLPPDSGAVHQLAAPGRAAVEASTAQLLSTVSRLEQRIRELEGGPHLAPEAPTGKVRDLLTEGQKYLDANQPVLALDYFDQCLAADPERTDAIVKRGIALEKLGREEEALACYNRAIAADRALVLAHLHKGGLLNRLRRYDEALNCYEKALLGQERKPKI